MTRTIRHVRPTEVNRVKSPATGEYAEFDPGTGHADVDDETASDLLDRYDDIQPVEELDDEPDADDSDTDK